MFKIKSVVFIVLILAVCSVFGKVSKLKNQVSSKMTKGEPENKQGGNQGSTQGDKPQEHIGDDKKDPKEKKKENHHEEDPIGALLKLIKQLLTEAEDPNALKRNLFGEQVHQQFEWLDSDGDQIVSFDEIIEPFKEVAESLELSDEDVEHELEELRDQFLRLDRDQNGGLDIHEYAELYREFLEEIRRQIESMPEEDQEEINEQNPEGITLLKVKAMIAKNAKKTKKNKNLKVTKKVNKKMN
jgi:hypothetical protein